jgi:D-threo-aldose 1-dehydrogenase
MNLQAFRQIGKTDLEIPVLGLGGSILGGFRPESRPVDDVGADAAYDAAWAAGIRYFDTAPAYGNGLGESRLGRLLRDRSRESFALSTKVGILSRTFPLETGSSPPDVSSTIVCDYGREATLRSIENSLRRLGTDQLDLVFIHDIDPDAHGRDGWKLRFREAMDGAYPALMRLKSEGVVRAVGVGVNSCEVCVECLKAADFDAFMLAGRYTLIDQSALRELLLLCEARGTSIIAAAPFNSGILANGPRPGARCNERSADPRHLGKVAAIGALCEQYEVSLGAAAVQFPLTHHVIAAVTPGPRTADQVRVVADWFREPISVAFWAALKDAGLINASVPISVEPWDN